MYDAYQAEGITTTKESPWGGVLEQVDPKTDLNKMLEKAGLNWDVEQYPAYAAIDGKRVDIGKKALVRTDTNEVLTVTGPNWKPTQNRDFVNFFREFVDAGKAEIERLGSLRNGKMIFCVAKLNTGFEVTKGDQVDGYIHAFAPHELGKAIVFRTTSQRLACFNQLVPWRKGTAGQYTQTHMHEFNQEEALNVMNLARDDIDSMGNQMRILQGQKVSNKDAFRLFAKWFQKLDPKHEDYKEVLKALENDPANQNKNLKNVLWAYEKAPGACPGNAWGVMNAVTYWADHMAGREKEARAWRATFGHTAKVKERVQGELIQMAA